MRALALATMANRIRARKNGTCVFCNAVLDIAKRWPTSTCEKCLHRIRREKADTIAKEAEIERNYRARIPCARCKKPFHSDDKRKIKRCDKCQEWLLREESLLPYDEARYEENVAGLSHLVNAKLKPGQLNDSKLYRERVADGQVSDYVGITCRVLSREEIEAQYTDAYLEELVKKAHDNFEANVMVPHVVTL